MKTDFPQVDNEKSPKIILIVQGRLGSSRLPQKAIYPLGSKTVLHQVLKNLRGCDVQDYFLATDHNSAKVFEEITKEVDFKLFVGPENDVLERFFLLIDQENPDIVVRATGDNPFLFTDAANYSIKRFLELNQKSKVDYFTLTGLPHGSGIEIFLGKSLLDARNKTNLAYDHEHVGPALYNHTENFSCLFEPAPENWNFPKLRTTIDTYFDFKKAEKLYQLLDCENQPIIDSQKLIEAYKCASVKNPVLFIPTMKKNRGTGHFRRCLNLAEKLDGFLYVDFENETEIPSNFSILLEKSTFAKSNLIFGKENLYKLAENQENPPFSLVILDSFRTSKKTVEIAEKLGKILTLDDGTENPKILDKINYLLDVIPSCKLKRNPNFKNSNFIPLPKNKKNQPVEKISTALISIGGEDPKAFSKIVESSLKKLGIDTTLVDVKNPIPNLKEELYKYDLIVTHYGFTAFEAKSAGSKVILVATSKLHKKLAKSEGFYCLSKGDVKNLSKIKEILAKLEAENQTFLEKSSENQENSSLEDFVLDFATTKNHLCPVCNSQKNTGKVIFRNKTRTVKKCKNCSTIYLNIETTPISDYSESYFFTDYKNQYGKTYLEDFEAIKNQGLRRAQIMKDFLLSKNQNQENALAPKLFDIGCAYGPFLAAAKEIGFSPFGTDISKSAVDYVSETLHFPAFSGEFTTTDFPEKFQAVSMWYVIEHFENLDKVLQKVNSLLDNQGIFAFSTPSASGVSGKFKSQSFFANSPVDHYSIWSFKSAKKVMKKYGFKVLKIHSTGHHPERFFAKPISKEKNPILWNIILSCSKMFKLGDTFEVYCKKIDNKF